MRKCTCTETRKYIPNHTQRAHGGLKHIYKLFLREGVTDRRNTDRQTDIQTDSETDDTARRPIGGEKRHEQQFTLRHKATGCRSVVRKREREFLLLVARLATSCG